MSGVGTSSARSGTRPARSASSSSFPGALREPAISQPLEQRFGRRSVPRTGAARYGPVGNHCHPVSPGLISYVAGQAGLCQSPGSPVRNTRPPAPPRAAADADCSALVSASRPTTTGHSGSDTLPVCPAAGARSRPSCSAGHSGPVAGPGVGGGAGSRAGACGLGLAGWGSRARARGLGLCGLGSWALA
jgi:hypothetical protein